MAKLSGIFEDLYDFESITADDVAIFLKIKVEAHVLENFIANRIIYPQTVPVNSYDLSIDLALLKAYLKKRSSYFYDPGKNKITIPLEYRTRFGDINSFITSLIDVLNLGKITQVFLGKDRGSKLIGSVVSPILPLNKDILATKINGEIYHLRRGSIINLPFNDHHIRLQIEDEPEVITPGGDLGILFDLRDKQL